MPAQVCRSCHYIHNVLVSLRHSPQLKPHRWLRKPLLSTNLNLHNLNPLTKDSPVGDKLRFSDTNLFLPQILFFGDLKLHAKFPNPSTTPSGRKVCGMEKKKNNHKISGHFIPLQRLRAAHVFRSHQYIIQHPMPPFLLYPVQPKEIDLWYILFPRAKHTWPLVYILLCFDIRHVISGCFIASLLCALILHHVHNNYISCLSVIYLFPAFLILMTFDVNSHQ